MTLLPRPSVWKAHLVGRRLRELGQHLAEINRRVRAAVAQAVRETVAQLARDAVDCVLPRRIFDPSMPQRYDDPEDEFDSWTDDEEPDCWAVPDEMMAAELVPEPFDPATAVPVARSALTLALAAAGWWLRRQGSLWGAFGIGLIAGAAAAVTRRLTGDGWLLVYAAHELLTCHAVSGLAAY
jgi:hypothetical protein